MSPSAHALQDCGVLVTDLPISRADGAMPDVRRRAPQEPYGPSSAPSHPERSELVLAIDRWNNEGGFVDDSDASLGRWRPGLES